MSGTPKLTFTFSDEIESLRAPRPGDVLMQFVWRSDAGVSCWTHHFGGQISLRLAARRIATQP